MTGFNYNLNVCLSSCQLSVDFWDFKCQYCVLGKTVYLQLLLFICGAQTAGAVAVFFLSLFDCDCFFFFFWGIKSPGSFVVLVDKPQSQVSVLPARLSGSLFGQRGSDCPGSCVMEHSTTGPSDRGIIAAVVRWWNMCCAGPSLNYSPSCLVYSCSGIALMAVPS